MEARLPEDTRDRLTEKPLQTRAHKKQAMNNMMREEERLVMVEQQLTPPAPEPKRIPFFLLRLAA